MPKNRNAVTALLQMRRAALARVRDRRIIAHSTVSRPAHLHLLKPSLPQGEGAARSGRSSPVLKIAAISPVCGVAGCSGSAAGLNLPAADPSRSKPRCGRGYLPPTLVGRPLWALPRFAPVYSLRSVGYQSTHIILGNKGHLVSTLY